MTVMWELDTPAEGAVTFLQGKGDPTVVRAPKPVVPPEGAKGALHLYAVKLTDLKPGTKYTYSVKSGNDISKQSSFHTFPEKADTFTLIAYGDSRSHPEIHGKLAAYFDQYKPAFILHSGDMVGNGPNSDEWRKDFFAPLASVIDHIPLFGARGNHERKGRNMDYYLSPPDGKYFYSFDYGSAHVICLQSVSEDALAWAEKDLAATKAVWKFAFYHYPSFNIGGHAGAWGQTTVVPILRKHKVDVTITGHSHLYERYYPLVPLKDPKAHPITHVVSGGGGAPKYGSRPHPCLASVKSISHFLVINVSPESITIDTRDIDNKRYDICTIKKKNGVYDQEYLSAAMPEEAVIISQRLAGNQWGRLQFQASGLPSPKRTVNVDCVYSGDKLDYPVKGTITLSEGSKKNYVMEPEELPFDLGTKATFGLRSKSRLKVVGGGINPPLSVVYRCKVGTVELKTTKGVDLAGALHGDTTWQPLGRLTPNDRKWSYQSFAKGFKPKRMKYWTRDVPFSKRDAKWFMPTFDASGWKTGKGPIGKGQKRACLALQCQGWQAGRSSRFLPRGAEAEDPRKAR